MEVTYLVFDGITPLDAIGPLEVLARIPNSTTKFVAKKRGPQRTKGGSFAMVADYELSEISRTDILVVPGGPGAGGLGDPGLSVDKEVTGWVRDIHDTTQFTTSVCTGALILGGAGLLRGLRAATHWRAEDDLAAFGATPVRERVVVQGKIITAAGVSSGIDMALSLAAMLAGEEIAKAIQLAIEYDPQPPFNAGSVVHASEDLVKLARTGLSRP